MKENIVLEPLAKKVVADSSHPPYIFELPVEEGRQKLEEIQSSYVYKYPAKICSQVISTGRTGNIKVYVVVPVSCSSSSKVIFYLHGAGWVFGSFHTHEKLVRELCARTNSVVVFPEYSRAPEARFPVALEQCFHIMCNIPEILSAMNVKVDYKSLIVAGDSAGGNMAISMAFMTKYQNGPSICKLLLYYPVTDDNFTTQSYQEFSDGYYLSRDEMKWFWNQYVPKVNERQYILASPFKATLQQLRRFPPTMIINGGVDVLFDDGEKFANHLLEAGVSVTQVCFPGMIHDFVMLHSLDTSNACRAAMDVSVGWIQR